MAHFVGLDVSVQETSVCVVDDVGKVLCERKVRTGPEDIAVLLTWIGGDGRLRPPFSFMAPLPRAAAGRTTPGRGRTSAAS